jgi:alpha-galactosidase
MRLCLPAGICLATLLGGALLVSATVTQAADAPRPLKVYILAGQSNMEGAGQIAAEPKRNAGQGSLEYLAKNPATAPQFGKLLNKEGTWAVRDDVSISYLDRKGPLTVGYGARETTIGPELGFGWVVGDASDDPVLLIKCAWGGKSLAIDFRPPSAGKFPYSLDEKTQAAIDADPNIVGKYYRETLSLVRETLANLDTLFPELAGRQPQLSGFAWHQGWNDRISNNFNGEYEQNMAHFIRDMRRDLKAPGLPFVIAETGMSGAAETHPRALSLMKAQAAVATHPEFQGNVAFVGTKAFYRDPEHSPSGQGYHWNSNAETYYLIGEGMAKAMLGLATDSKN